LCHRFVFLLYCFNNYSLAKKTAVLHGSLPFSVGAEMLHLMCRLSRMIVGPDDDFDSWYIHYQLGGAAILPD